MEQNIQERHAGFVELARNNFSPHSLEMICDALSLAAEKLDGYTRYDSSPLLDHSVSSARIVISEIGLGRNSTIAILLHDAVRMELVSVEQVSERFGEAVGGIIVGMNHISGVKTKVEAKQADNFRELIISYSTDPRVILIKLADRLEVMRSLAMFPPEKRTKKSWESLNLYAQIAHKLGLYSLKSELEDLSLSYLEPADYRNISERLEETASERNEFIARFVEPIDAKLRQSGIKYHIKSRTKSIYSIWRKMKKSDIGFDEVYDIFAIRIVIDCPEEQEKQFCWNVYSIVTDFYAPNPERLRDWISIPKSNGYESLHTTVVTKQGKWVEIQIRTERMDEVAERGIAAHWRYKGVKQGGMGSEEWLAKLRELVEDTATDKKSISQRFDTALSSGEIFVFTPTGDIKKLREGSTVLDFAFDIHSSVGASCTGARIENREKRGENRNVSIREELHNGDMVTILTSKTQKPKADWLNIVVTSKARSKIKAFLREEQAKQARLGREELERKIKNWKLSIAIDDAVTLLCRYYKLKTGIELYGNIASGKIDIAQTKEIITRHLNGEPLDTAEAPVRARTTTTAKTPDKENDALVIDDSIRGLDYKLAKCCNPIFGDHVFGFTTINNGITIHRDDCPNAARLKANYPYRVMPARWRHTSHEGSFGATIRIAADETTGIVNQITDVIANEMKINIRSINISSSPKGLIGIITVEVTSSGTVDSIIYRLLKIKEVRKAYRING